MILLLFSSFMLTSAVFMAVFRQELVEARVRAVERSKWLRGGPLTGYRSAYVAAWLGVLMFTMIGLAFGVMGIAEMT